jgi:hypothetical protein
MLIIISILRVQTKYISHFPHKALLLLLFLAHDCTMSTIVALVLLVAKCCTLTIARVGVAAKKDKPPLATLQ